MHTFNTAVCEAEGNYFAGQARVRTNGRTQLFRFQEEFAGQLAMMACPEHVEVTLT